MYVFDEYVFSLPKKRLLSLSIVGFVNTMSCFLLFNVMVGLFFGRYRSSYLVVIFSSDEHLMTILVMSGSMVKLLVGKNRCCAIGLMWLYIVVQICEKKEFAMCRSCGDGSGESLTISNSCVIAVIRPDFRIVRNTILCSSYSVL